MNQFDELPHDDNLRTSRPVKPSGRKKADKGLPDEAARKDLARTYIDLQRRLWPELVRTKLLPQATTKSVTEMADQFRDLYIGDDPPPEYSVTPKFWQRLGAAYLRYSCENSNPRSLDQQLKNVLESAAHDKVFIPWRYVFADAAVTGTIAARRGYQMAKAAVKLNDGGPHDFYVDDTGRASRDAIEVLTLGRLIRAHEKRLVGVSDGFDSDEDFSKMKLQIFAMVQEWFVDQLRAKVLRGEIDGFLRGKNLGPAPLGYKLVNRTDANGNSVLDDDGRPEKEKAIDEAAAEHVREAFQLYADCRWSKGRIAKHFNTLEVGGARTWDAGMIRQVLIRETYIGVEHYGMTRQRRDPETGAVVTIRRHRNEWLSRSVPHLRIISDEMWQKTQARLKECHEAYRKRMGDKTPGATRSSVYPTLLIRPVCGYCGNELWLGRAGKYASFCCLNGSSEKNGCKLRTYKSVGIVEKAVIGQLKSAVFTPGFINDLVSKANMHLRVEAKRPKGNAGAIQSEIKGLERKRDRLVEACAAGGGEVAAIVATLKSYEGQLTELRDRLRELEGPIEMPPPITVTDVERLVADLHTLLGEDTATVAPIIRELTGPVTVTQDEQEKGKRGATWIAQFEVNLVPVLTRLTRQQDCPSSGAWGYLHSRGWKSLKQCETRVEFVPKHETLAGIVKDMVDGGASLHHIATALGQSYATVRNALIFAQSGERPKTTPPGRRTGTRTGPPQYITLAPKVAHLRDVDYVPFCTIAVRLKISEPTARRAYDYAHRDEIREAVKEGRSVGRGRFVRLPVELRQEIIERLNRGESAEFIAGAVGCSACTVRRIGREK